MPKPHDERSEYRCYHEALEQIVLADRLGFDTVWEVEHHIGYGVVLLPHKFNHPIRVAERVATLDLLLSSVGDIPRRVEPHSLILQNRTMKMRRTGRFSKKFLDSTAGTDVPRAGPGTHLAWRGV